MLYNTITIVMLISILFMLFTINTILGILIDTKKNNFNWKKFNRGILKLFLFSICIIAYYYALELFEFVLLRIEVVIPNDIFTFIELIGIIISAYKKYVSDCFKKIKKILEVDSEI